MLAEILLGAEASRTTRELFNAAGSTVCRAYAAGQGGSRRRDLFWSLFGTTEVVPFPVREKSTAKSKDSGQECPLRTSGGDCCAGGGGPHM